MNRVLYAIDPKAPPLGATSGDQRSLTSTGETKTFTQKYLGISEHTVHYLSVMVAIPFSMLFFFIFGVVAASCSGRGCKHFIMQTVVLLEYTVTLSLLFYLATFIEESKSLHFFLYRSY